MTSSTGTVDKRVCECNLDQLDARWKEKNGILKYGLLLFDKVRQSERQINIVQEARNTNHCV